MEAKDKNPEAATVADERRKLAMLAYPTRRECEIIAEVAKKEAARDAPEFVRSFTKRHADALREAWQTGGEGLAADIFEYAYTFTAGAAEMLERYTAEKPPTKEADAEAWRNVEKAIELNNRIAAQGLQFVALADGLRRLFVHYCQCLYREMGAERWEANFKRQYDRLGDGDKIAFAALLDLGGRGLILHIAELEKLCKALAENEAQGDAPETIPADAGVFSYLQGVANLPPDVTTSERCVLFALITHRNFKTGDCFPTVATLASDAALSTRQTKRILSRLSRRGLVQTGKRKTRDGDGNTYALFLPEAGQRVSPMTPTKEGQRVSPMTPTDISDGDICATDGDICDMAEGVTHDTLTKNIRTSNNNGGGVIAHTPAHAREEQPAAAASSVEDSTISAIAKFLNDSSPNRAVWLDGLRRIGERAFRYLAGKAKEKATKNAGACFSSMLPNADPEAIRLEVNGERRKIYIFCKGKCANFFDDSSDGGWIGCKARLNPKGNYDLTKCPNFTPTAESAPPQSTEEGRRAATSAREARDDKYIS